jgi:hypothetical protein
VYIPSSLSDAHVQLAPSCVAAGVGCNLALPQPKLSYCRSSAGVSMNTAAVSLPRLAAIGVNNDLQRVLYRIIG